MPDAELPEDAIPVSRYVLDVQGPVYQHDDDGVLRLIDGADLHPGRPFFLIPSEEEHEQGDVPPCSVPHDTCWCGWAVDRESPVAPYNQARAHERGELSPEWRAMGLVEGDEVSLDLNGPTRVNGIPVRPMRMATTTAEDVGAAIREFGYAAAEVATRFGEAASLAFPKTMSDNGYYVVSHDARQPVHAGRDTGIPAVTLASPTVNGLGREHIVDHLPLEHPVPYVALPVSLGGLPEDAPERQLVRSNRADRRRAKKGRNRA